nr:MAG TPA_asm: hypothetical protein [Caudoviricetes sp.]
MVPYLRRTRLTTGITRFGRPPHPWGETSSSTSATKPQGESPPL